MLLLPSYSTTGSHRDTEGAATQKIGLLGAGGALVRGAATLEIRFAFLFLRLAPKISVPTLADSL